MNPNHEVRQDAAKYNPTGRQDNDKTAKTVRLRLGVGTVGYWKSKLFRNTYRDRNGATVEIPEYYAWFRHAGVSRRVRLGSSDKDKAAELALLLSQRLAAEGWSAVNAGMARLPNSPTIEAYCDAYEKAAASFENAPRPISIAQYHRHLKQICALGGVKNLRELTPEAIERARDAYRSKGRAEKRPESAVQNSFGIMIRNASACFSSEARAILARNGFMTDNPFKGVRRTQRIEPVTALPRETAEQIWASLPALRDGDPTAADPNLPKFARTYRRKHGGRKARWLPVDYRRPHPDAYCAVLLAFGLGLRANEIDKARWSWLKFDSKGDCFLEIREEKDFKPKGGTLRILRVPVELHAELVKTRTDASSPYILGGQESESVIKHGWGYRCREALRVANDWLRARGVEAGEAKGNPLHRLRKQFGSEVATGHGLFAAQKLLGHASPTTTSRYYATQTNLPALTHVHIAG